MGGRITALQEQIRGFRTALNEKATQLVQNFKENGVMALNHVCDFLGVKDTMVQLKISMLSSAADMQKSMDKIDQVSQELREVSTPRKKRGQGSGRERSTGSSRAKRKRILSSDETAIPEHERILYQSGRKTGKNH